jgi:hypothetical protein
MHLFARNAILLVLAAFGYVALWKFASDNGTFSLMHQWALQNRLPGTGEVYATEFTRLRWLDNYLKSLTTMFWPMVNGTQLSSSLMCFYFAGQGIVAWILTVLEGQRRLNRDNWKVVSFTTTYGLLFQGLGIGIVGPIFLALSPLGDRRTCPVLVHKRSDLSAIIPATIGGIIIPTVIMSLHEPTVISLHQQIDLVRLWQFFPLLFRLGQRVWTAGISVWLGEARDVFSIKDIQGQRAAYRRVYMFALGCAAVPHIGTIAVCTTALLLPRSFESNFAKQLHPMNIFVPMLPFSGVEAATVGIGAHWFLQWDMVLMFCTYLVWAYFAAIKVKQRGSGLLSTSLILRLSGWTLLFGPMGAALLAIWERDELVLDALEQKIKSRKDTPQNLVARAKYNEE